jgi:hypothetical protein
LNGVEKKDEDPGSQFVAYLVLGLAILLLTAVQFLIFGLLTLSCHRSLKHQYFPNEEGAARRVNDIRAVLRPFSAWECFFLNGIVRGLRL